MGDGVGDLAFWLAMGGLGLGLTFGPIGRAVAQVIEAMAARLAGRGAETPTGGTIAAVAERVQQLEGLEHRLLEMEERLDFAERLLTSGQRADPGTGTQADTPPERMPSAR